MKYDSQQHLLNYETHGVFPAIHDKLFLLVATESSGSVLCDLGCSIGLFGQRVITTMKFIKKVVGIEADERAIKRAREAGIEFPIKHQKITRQNMEEAAGYMKSHGVDMLVARRVFPEIFGEDLEAGKLFAEMLAVAGVKEIFIQGRQPHDLSTHPLSTVAAEVDLLTHRYKCQLVQDQLAYLTLI